jgi:hypothetical protein
MTERDWHDYASDLYRLGWTELANWRGPQPPEIEYFVEELKEALLDVKQSTLGNDAARFALHAEEVLTLLLELRHRSREK